MDAQNEQAQRQVKEVVVEVEIQTDVEDDYKKLRCQLVGTPSAAARYGIKSLVKNSLAHCRPTWSLRYLVTIRK